MDRRASTAETVCETGLRRIAEATARAGLSKGLPASSGLPGVGRSCERERSIHRGG